MPKREPLRPLRRAFKRIERCALSMGYGRENFDRDPYLSHLDPDQLIIMATNNPQLRSQGAIQRLEAIRSSMLTLAMAEVKLTNQMKGTKEVEDDG